MRNLVWCNVVCMAAGKGNPVYVNEYLRHWIEEDWIPAGHNAKELAVECGVSPTAVSDFRAGKRGAGYGVAKAIARLQGRSRDDMEREALEWWKARGGTVQNRDDPYPNRAAALEFLKNEVPAEVLARVREISLDVSDPSRAWWVARILSEADLRRTGTR